MANMLIPAEERNLTPDQVEELDKRRTWGLTLQVIAGLLAIIGVISVAVGRPGPHLLARLDSPHVLLRRDRLDCGRCAYRSRRKTSPRSA